MEALRYKAFISYSHKQEAWARWLQHALERYRVPSRLVGEDGAFGSIPSRLRPIFRDREDLSSSADLSLRIREELARSETLIVICSPDAAASRWVNEEILHFEKLGRGDRILCLIVDGDPHASGQENCFPKAVLKFADGSRHEPLAADARRYADGKRLAFLKIVAGILGIRLDKLRQRDAQRRHRVIALSVAAGMLLTLTITWLTYSQVTTRAAAEAQRVNTEELLRFMLGDLQRLEPIQGLEQISPDDTEQARFKAELGLDAMSADALITQAQSWRNQGVDLNWEGSIETADEKFRQSRAALIELYQREGSTPRAMFELAQSEYYVGEIHFVNGEIDEALRHWTQYGALARRLVNSEPNNPRYVMELSYSLMNLGALEQQRPAPDASKSLALVQTAVQYNQMALVLDPGNAEYLNSLMNNLAWLADAWVGKCALGKALEARQKAVELGREALSHNPKDAYQRGLLALYLGGLAGVQQDIGLNGPAGAILSEARELLRQLHLAEPNNQNIEWQMLYLEARLARLHMASGATSVALETMERIAPRIEDLAEQESDSSHLRAVEATLFALDHAQLLLLEDPDQGQRKLREATKKMAKLVRLQPGLRSSLKGLAIATFRYWEQFGEIPGDEWSLLSGDFSFDHSAIENCTDANLTARMAVMDGNHEQASDLTRYLLGMGYFDADFVTFCQNYDTCDLR